MLAAALAQCPWSDFTPPTMKYCEENLCSWITQPANTWSNLGYILIGLWLISRNRLRKSPLVKLIGVAAVLIGVASFAYHASFTFPGQVVDLASMFLFSSLLVVLNLRRIGWTRQHHLGGVLVGLNVVSVVLLLVLRKVGIFLFGGQVLLALYLEWRVRFTGRAVREVERPDWALVGAAVAFVVSYVFWALDYFRIACAPHEHVWQGHAAWHVVNASCFGFLYHYYRGIEGHFPRAAES